MMNLFKRNGFSMKNKWLNIAGSPFNGLEHTPSKSVLTWALLNFHFWLQKDLKSVIFPKGLPIELVINVSNARDQATCYDLSVPISTCHERLKKKISTIDDPFDAQTYNIPEKPVTFTEGVSYSLIILAGLQHMGYKMFGKALERIQNDCQVRVRIGTPVTGYGSESRNRDARQRIPNNKWTNEDGVEHVVVNFQSRGPNGAGKIHTEMFKDKVDKQWKFMYLIVEVTSPSPAQLMFESYVPA